MNIIYYIIIIIICIIFIYFINYKKDKCFYNVNEIDINLNNIDKIRDEIYEETIKINKKENKWQDWVEKNLYNKTETKSWKIFPFYAFGTWANDNCKACPIITKFLKSLKNLKLATLSKLSSKIKLVPHRGWGFHSNNVIRCHYGIVVPKLCYISVSNYEPNITKLPLYENNKYKIDNYPNNINYNNELIQFHKKFEWVIFDDSKTHYAENLSDEDRIVLIIDIERPRNIKQGTSQIGDTKELNDIIKYYKNL